MNKINLNSNNISFGRIVWQKQLRRQTEEGLNALRTTNPDFYANMFREFYKIKNFPEDVFISCKILRNSQGVKYTIDACDKDNKPLADITYFAEKFWFNTVASNSGCKRAGDFADCARESLDKITPPVLNPRPGSNVRSDMKYLELN